MAQDKREDIDLGLTRFEYDDPASHRHAVLTIDTGKRLSGGIASSATVFWVGDHSRQHTFGLAGGGDFSRKLKIDKTARATQKAIDTQHAAVFTPDAIAALAVEAKAYYAQAEAPEPVPEPVAPVSDEPLTWTSVIA